MKKLYSRNRFINLVKKYISGKTTPGEKTFLYKYYDQFEAKDSGLSNLPEDDLAIVKGRMKNKIWADTLLKKEVAPKKGLLVYLTNNLKKTVAAAAVFIAVLSISILWFTGKNKLQQNAGQNQPVANHTKKQSIQPGSDKAILTLSDGSTITLDSVGNSTINSQGNTAISSKNGKVIYAKAGVAATEQVFNTIATPRGGQYQVVLSDGTQVWLNASSSLHYPVVFNSNERKVELTGEAYFEVAKNASHPFIVNVKDVNVKVLGTHFNIMSFDDEDRIATTLLEGAVNVTKRNESVLMKPGQQIRYYNNGKTEIKNDVDVEEVVAWKNGKFHFADADIKTIMRQLSRWYNIDVSYAGNIPQTMFGGIIGRKQNVNELLKLFELTGKVHFKIEGTKITVMN
jgi:transmembrane sensor